MELRAQVDAYRDELVRHHLPLPSVGSHASCHTAQQPADTDAAALRAAGEEQDERLPSSGAVSSRDEQQGTESMAGAVGKMAIDWD